ncbi:hypothetical protein [Nocardia uniformis]|nr:hypothetical protein [Nocardia uniformis]
MTALLKYARSGDTIVVYNLREVLNLVQGLRDKGIGALARRSDADQYSR